MPSISITLHPPGAPPVPGTLTTTHPASSHGQPVLLLRPQEAGQSFPEDSGPVPFGPGDLTRWGAAGAIPFRAPDPNTLPASSRALVAAWERLGAPFRDPGPELLVIKDLDLGNGRVLRVGLDLDSTGRARTLLLAPGHGNGSGWLEDPAEGLTLPGGVLRGLERVLAALGREAEQLRGRLRLPGQERDEEDGVLRFYPDAGEASR